MPGARFVPVDVHAARVDDVTARRIPELDGIRALAALWVVLHHAFYAWPTPDAALERWPSALMFVLSRGWLGVDLFFVLSGLLITGILLDSRERPSYWSHFYARRALRILPIYLVVLVVCWFAYAGFDAYFGLSLGMLANFARYFDAAIPHGPGVFWSLAVEEQFYFVWPLVVWLLTRRGVGNLALALVVGTPVLRGAAVAYGLDVEREVYFYSWFRFDGLALGALLAIWMRSGPPTPRRSAGLVAALVGVAVIVTIVGWPFGLMQTKTLVSSALRHTQMQLMFGAGIVAAIAMRGSAWTAFLRSPFARTTSAYSYCLYLVHLSLGDGYVGWIEGQFLSPGPIGPDGLLVLRVVAVLAVSYAVAAVSYHVLEAPMLRLKRLFGDDEPTPVLGGQLPSEVRT
jgi:peptidoglycan/LPS O-acetylase OafA/YrhL